MTATLQIANLNYGARPYKVVPNDTLPLPTEFDFDDIVECARKVLAIMSNASGGHRLTDCKVSVHGKTSANIVASGVHVFYQDKANAPSLKTEADIVKFVDEVVLTNLGTVFTDQYGDGWKRARWSK